MEPLKQRYRTARASGSFKQAGSFGLVGLVNTALDFGIFNMATLVLQMPPVPSNVISTSATQVVSFLLNRTFVFRQAGRGSGAKTMLRFVAVTAVGLYAIQNVTIFVFAHLLTWPGELATGILHGLGFTQLGQEAVVANVAKAIATVFSAAWNFVGYKKFVFTAGDKTGEESKAAGEPSDAAA